MRSTRPLLAAGILTLAIVPGCCWRLLAFHVPTHVWVGAEFEVTVQSDPNAAPPPQGCPTGDAGAVLQIPNGIQVVGAAAVGQNNPRHAVLLDRDVPALVAAYTAEPGHYLASFSAPDGGGGLAGEATLKVYLRPSLGSVGPHTLKVALAVLDTVAGTVALEDPPGVASFASISTAPYVQTTTVVADPTTDFALDSDGLPRGGQDNWNGLAALDLDGDGRDDLAAVGNSVRAFLSRPAAPWLEVGNGLPQSSCSDVASGDFNGDGIADLVNGCRQAFLGDGAGNWLPANYGLPVGPWATSVETGDVNGDGFDDLAFATGNVFLSTGQGGWSESSTGLTGGGGDVVLADVTADGFLDFVVTTGGGGPSTTIVHAGDGLGNWTAAPALNGGPVCRVGDVDGNGIPELLVGGINQLPTVYRWGGSPGNYQWTAVANTRLPNFNVSDMALLDFDRDGLLDLVLSEDPNSSSGSSVLPQSLSLWRNLGGSRFALVHNAGLPGQLLGVSAVSLAVGDFNADSFPDLAAADSTEGLLVWLNTRTGPSYFGAPCIAPNFPIPMLGQLGRPARGNMGFGYTISGGESNGVALFWLGSSSRFSGGQPILPYPLAAHGAPGCFVLADPAITLLAALDINGATVIPMPVPAANALLRETFFGQGMVSAPGANAMGFLFSAGLAARIE